MRLVLHRTLQFLAGGGGSKRCSKAQHCFEAYILTEGRGNVPSVAAEATPGGMCLPATWRLVGSPVWRQIILNSRPRG